MVPSKSVQCSICHQPMKTAQGAIRLKDTPMVCRRCFGETSYTSLDRWTVISGQYNPAADN